MNTMKIKHRPKPVRNYRYQVSLDRQTVKLAQAAGGGNLSAGLRLAVAVMEAWSKKE